MASFLVPLNLNKLDLKDYLYHAYQLPALSVRSYIQQQKVRQDKPDKMVPAQRRWFRPRAIKKMTVEMERPFVWPGEPSEYDAWDKAVYDKASEANDEERDRVGPDAANRRRSDGDSVREQARALLQGKERWRPMWVDFGPPREVEVGMEETADGEGAGAVDVPLKRGEV